MTRTESTSLRWERAKVLSLGMIIILLAVNLGAYIGMATNPSFSTVIQPGSMTGTSSYVVFKDGSNIFVKNGTTGAILTSSASAATALQAGINAAKASQGTLFIREGNYSLGGTTLNVSSVGVGSRIEIIGAGKYSTILSYTGTGSALIIDGTTGTIGGTVVSDIGFYCTAACTGLKLKDYSLTNVLTRGVYANLHFQKVASGIVIDANGQSVIYRNSFRGIDVVGATAFGLQTGGSYNDFQNIEVTQAGSYAIKASGSYDHFSDVSTDGEIWSVAGGALWEDVIIETIYAAATPTTEAFRLDGAKSAVIDLTLATVAAAKSTYGLSIYSVSETIINFAASGGSYPTYSFNPNVDSSGVCINVGGSSGFWSHLTASKMALWSCQGGSLETHGKVTLSSNTTYAVPHRLATTPNFVSISANVTACGAIAWTSTASMLTLTAASSCTATVYWDAEV